MRSPQSCTFFPVLSDAVWVVGAAFSVARLHGAGISAKDTHQNGKDKETFVHGCLSGLKGIRSQVR